MARYNKNNCINLKIIQWNARSINANIESLEKIIYSLDIDIVILSETWLKKTEIYRVPGYFIYREDRENGYGGVAILVKKQINHVKLDLSHGNINFEFVGISVGVGTKFKINLISTYATPGTVINYTNW